MKTEDSVILTLAEMAAHSSTNGETRGAGGVELCTAHVARTVYRHKPSKGTHEREAIGACSGQ